MSIFTPSHTPSSSSRLPSSPGYALPSRLPARQSLQQQQPASSPQQTRARTRTSSSAASPSTSRSYHAANTSLNLGGGGGGGSQSGTPTTLLNRRSYQQPLGTGGSVRRGEGTGRALKRSVGCDVVLDTTRAHNSNLYDFVASLGTPIQPPLTDDDKKRAKTPRPNTPKREPRLDLAAVRQNLRELHETELSYCRKMQSVTEHLARPLRQFASRPATAVISKEAAQLLFGNIEELVPVAEQFAHDLGELVAELESILARDRSSEEMPRNMGATILRNVERMAPFQTWLNNAGDCESTYRALERHTQFHNYLHRQIMIVRQQARSTGGLQELLAEPFQRISRYRLMIDPIIRHLPQDDPNVPYLEDAVDKLSDLCSMETDEVTRRTAEMWALFYTIDGLPQSLVKYSARQFLGSVDVDEVVDGSVVGSAYTLRCCLFLFSDKVIIAKRPSGEKGARQLAGLDNVDALVKQFKLAQRNSAEANLLAQGSPRKLAPDKIRKGVMGFRGALDLLQLRVVDLGANEFGLVLDQPPVDQNERWCGRPARRYVLASTYAPDCRTQEKRAWLARIEDAQAQRRIALGAPGVRRSLPIPAAAQRGDDAMGAEGGRVETVIYWTVWDRHSWEHAKADAKAKLAIHMDEEGDAPELRLGFQGVPQVIARATFEDGPQPERCLFSVRSSNATQPKPEWIALDRVSPAIAEIALSFGLCTFPIPRPGHGTPGSLGKARPRSFLGSSTLGSSLGGALELLGAGSLKRGDSKLSRASTATTTSRYTGFSSSISSATAFSPRQMLSKKSAPELYGSTSANHRASKSVSTLGDTVMGQEEQEELDYGAITKTAPALESLAPPGQDRPRDHRHRRSLSLPPPLPARLASSTSPEPQAEPELEEDNSALPERPDAPFEDARNEHSWLQEDSLANVQTSPIAYRAPQQPASGRRLMGPRAPAPSPLNLQGAGDYSSNYDSPTRATTPQPRDPELSASTGSKRTATSPRPSPAKKSTASIHSNEVDYSPNSPGLPRGPGSVAISPLSITRRAPSVASRIGSLQRRIPAEGSHPRRGSVATRRVASGASTIRASSPPLTVEEPEEELVQVVQQSEDSPAARLQKHVKAFRAQLMTAREADDKENARAEARGLGGLHRSPPTQNVALKAASNSASFASAFAKTRVQGGAGAGPDVASLLRWTDELSELAERVADDGTPRAASPVGPTKVELATLEAERDFLQAELNARDAQLAHATQSESNLTEELCQVRTALGEQQALYAHALKMIDNVQLLWEELDTIDREAGGVEGDPVALLQARVAREMRARTEADHKLGVWEMERAGERERMRRMEEVLRANGLSVE